MNERKWLVHKKNNNMEGKKEIITEWKNEKKEKWKTKEQWKRKWMKENKWYLKKKFKEKKKEEVRD